MLLENGSLEIVTATFTVAEVAYARSERDNRATDPAIETQIDAYGDKMAAPPGRAA